MRKSPTGSYGFTLLELLLALSIGSIVVAAVYGTFHTAIKAKTRAEEAMTPLRNARYFFSAIKGDLMHIRGDAHVADLLCEGDHCGFPIRADNKPANVRYLLNSRRELVKEFWPDEADADKADRAMVEKKSEVLGRDVLQLHFDKQVKRNRATGGATVLLSISVNFAAQPEPMRYEYAIFVEKTLQP